MDRRAIINMIVGKNETLTKLDPKLCDKLIAIFRGVGIVKQPQFRHDTLVERASLVMDSRGVAWWVDPNSQTICRAVAR